MKPKVYKYIIIIILLLIIFYLGVSILNNKTQHFTISINCDEAFKKAEKYKTQLNLITRLNIKKGLSDRLNFLLEMYSISFKCLGQQVAINNVIDINIDVLEQAIDNLSVECHKTILDCYKYKLINNIKSLLSSKLNKYIYNTEVFNRDGNNILPINYFIQSLKKQIDKKKVIPLDEFGSNPLLKKHGDNLINILLNVSQEISSIEKKDIDSDTNSFLKVYKHIYTIYTKNIDLQTDVNMSIIKLNEPTPLSSEDERQKSIDDKYNLESNGPTDIFDSKYLIKFENKILDIYLEDIYNITKTIGSTNDNNKINLVEIKSIETFLKNVHIQITDQENSSTQINSIMDIRAQLLENIKSNNNIY